MSDKISTPAQEPVSAALRVFAAKNPLAAPQPPPAQEPIGWITPEGMGCLLAHMNIPPEVVYCERNERMNATAPLYAAPQQSAPAQPVAWRYLYHDPHGSDMRIWHNSSNWNGMTPIESQPLYASPQPDEAVALLRALEPHLDKLICYASTTDEYEPNAIVARIRAFLKDRT